MSTMMAERSRSLPFMLKPSKLDGTLAGDEGFDPLGLSNIDDIGIDLYWMREAELKHARVAMLATLGLLAQESGLIVPGMPTAKNQVDTFWTLVDSNAGPIFAAVIFIGFFEIISGFAVTEGRKSGNRAPGDFSFNPLNMGKTDASAKDLALKEIRNGRLAMWAAAGILLQSATTHEGALANLF
ncbi:fucoxanthin chl a/c light-harvesting protein [Ochromonadaceae sp. CCMP2298]|nr:fucoxanthin chl a/c light-harvesting protein [Ochromonadaceae sp. CCMP2298]